MAENIEVKQFGKRKERPDVTVLVPHDASFEDFSLWYPDVLREIVFAMEPASTTPEQTETKAPKKKKSSNGIAAYEAREKEKDLAAKKRDETEAQLKKLITIERDMFAMDAGKQMANKILEETKGEVRVELIKVMIPRVIIDMNRVEEKAFPKLIDHDEHPDILRELRTIYRSTFRAIQSAIKGSNMLIDLHTMSPTAPWKRTELNPQNITEFMEDWRPNTGSPRVNDIITRRRDQEGLTHPLGDPALIAALKAQFEKEGIVHGFSKTFELSNDHLGPQWAQQVRSYVNLDLTKDNGSKERVGDKKFDLAHLTLDEERLKRVTNPIGLAIADVVRQRSKETRMVV